LLMPGLSFDDNICGTDNDFDRPSGTGPLCIATRALRAWLRSACPSGTKAIRPSKRQTIILALMGLKPWAKFFNLFGAIKHPKLHNYLGATRTFSVKGSGYSRLL
jgi:hypothetical protein